MTPLERRYRRLLRALPEWYRQAHEDALVSRFMERARTGDTEADDHRATFGRPAASDCAEIAGLATKLRLGGAGAPARSRVTGDGLRRFALLGLLAQAATSTMDIAQSLWLGGMLPIQAPGGNGGLTSLTGAVPAEILAPLVALAWLISFLSLAAGGRRLPKISASAAVTLLLYGALAGGGGAPPRMWLAAAAPLLMGGLILLAMAGFHEDAPRIRGTAWVTGYAAAVTALLGAQLWMARAAAPFPLWVDLPGAYVSVAVVTATAHIARPWVTARRRNPAWSVALAWFAGSVAAVRALSSAAYAGAPNAPDSAVAIVWWQTAAAVAAALALAAIASRSMRQLDRDPAGQAAGPVP